MYETPDSKFKRGDHVWVNESTLGGKPLKHKWHGRIVKIHTAGMIANVEDTSGDTYDGEVYPRFVRNLEPYEERGPDTETRQALGEIQEVMNGRR